MSLFEADHSPTGELSAINDGAGNGFGINRDRFRHCQRATAIINALSRAIAIRAISIRAISIQGIAVIRGAQYQ